MRYVQAAAIVAGMLLVGIPLLLAIVWLPIALLGMWGLVVPAAFSLSCLVYFVANSL